MKKKDDLSMFDRDKKVYVKIQMSKDKKYWERWVSKTKVKWELDRCFKNFSDALKTQEEIINNNYRNLYNKIMKK